MNSIPELPAKAEAADFRGRFREIVSDPLNALIHRHPLAGTLRDGEVVLHNGLRVPAGGAEAYYGDFSSILVVNRGVHEPLEELLFQQVLRMLPAAPAMLELGAYWGHYSMWLKSVRPQARVELVEPEAANLDVGRRNFARNGLDGHFRADFVGEGRFAVDERLDAGDLSRLAILHADIQGYEVEMLHGTRRSLAAKRIDHVFVSTHSQELHAEVIRLLGAAGYRVEVSSDFARETTSYDGLVYASSPDRPPSFHGFEPVGRADLPALDARAILAYLARSAASLGLLEDPPA